MKRKIVSIWLDGELFGIKTFRDIERTNRFLSSEAFNAPPPGGAYDKVNFRITFENGPNGEEESLNGRIDLHNNDVGKTLTNHLLHECRFYTRKPAWMSEERYSNILLDINNETFEFYKTFEENFDFGQD